MDGSFTHLVYNGGLRKKGWIKEGKTAKKSHSTVIPWLLGGTGTMVILSVSMPARTEHTPTLDVLQMLQKLNHEAVVTLNSYPSRLRVALVDRKASVMLLNAPLEVIQGELGLRGGYLILQRTWRRSHLLRDIRRTSPPCGDGD